MKKVTILAVTTLVIVVLVFSLFCDLLYLALTSTQPMPSTNTRPYKVALLPGEILSNEFAVLVNGGELVAKSLGQQLNLSYKGRIGTLPNYYLFIAHDLTPTQATHVVAMALRSNPSVGWFEQQILKWRHPRRLIVQSPNSTTRYNSTFEPEDPEFPEQWHLNNTGQHGGTEREDMRVLDAWKISRGYGICIAIVDDGLMYLHPDLKQRYSAANSHNFNADGAPSDPMPIPGDSHGTMCAGAAAATTNNVCGVGVAFEAQVSGLRILGGPSSDAMEAQALTHMYKDNHIYSSSWGPTDNGLTLEGPGPLTKAALADGVSRGRGGKGSVYIWAAGNGARFGDNCNYDGYASSRFVLTVGAVNHFGAHAYYSEPCAAIIVSAPSSGQDLVGITTTDMNNDCTNDFTGTSASAPLVAGVAALMLSANNNLTWRDVHHIMARTARRNDPNDSDWVQNGAGLFVNHKYGFGVVDAHAAVTLALSWESVDREIAFVSPVIDVYTPIADHSQIAIQSSFNVDVDIILEHVEVVFTAFHPFRSDLRVVLTSPANTKSVLSTLHGTSSLYEFQVLSPKNITKKYQLVRASFGPSPAEWELQNATSQIVYDVDHLDGCDFSNSTVDLRGMLVLVTQGNCKFTQKVKEAQSRGAAAVLVVPKDGEPPTEMNGMDSSIVIPSVMLTGRDGHQVLAHLQRQTPVIGMLVANVQKQGGLLPFNDWTFSTVRCWNESSTGRWTLAVSDLSTGGVGTFDRWQLKLYGTRGTTPVPTVTPSLHHHRARVNSGKIVLFAVAAVGIAMVSIVLVYWVLRHTNGYERTQQEHPLQTKAVNDK